MPKDIEKMLARSKKDMVKHINNLEPSEAVDMIKTLYWREDNPLTDDELKVLYEEAVGWDNFINSMIIPVKGTCDSCKETFDSMPENRREKELVESGYLFCDKCKTPAPLES